MLNTEVVKHEFPIFDQAVYNGKPLVYLDNAATTQKPRSVIDAISDFYGHHNANIHRGIYRLSQRATERYDDVREKVKNLVNANSNREIVFTKGTTESINLVARSYLDARLKEGDNIVISAMEHHSNMIPWQAACQRKGAEIRVAPISELGVLDLEKLAPLVDSKTKLIAIVHISNTLGTVNPIREIIEIGHQKGVPVLVDAAQSLAYHAIDVQSWDCDFLVGSSHKMFGPTGVGFLYAKAAHLLAMEPYQYGGDMIRSVSYQEATYADIPRKFEGGTPNIAGIIGFGAAIDYIQSLDRGAVRRHLMELRDYATAGLNQLGGIRIIGNAPDKSGIVSFIIPGIHPHDIATFLDEDNVCIRAGHHCTQPLMDFFRVPATVRASFAVYNNTKDLDILLESLIRVKEFFGK